MSRERSPSARFRAVPGYPELEIDSESGIYYVRKYVAGRGELFKSTRSKKVRLAKTIADEMIAEFMTRKRGMKAKRIRIADLCPLLLESLREETRARDDHGNVLRRESTFRKDRCYLETKFWHGAEIEAPIIKFFGDYFVDEIDEQFWKSWVKTTGRKEGRRLGDIAKYLSLVLDYAFTEKYIDRKPRISNPDSQANKAVVYTIEQIKTFYAHADPILRDMIIMATENPVRPHEVIGSQWSMFHFDGGVVIYRIPDWFAKIGKGRELILSPNTLQMLLRRKKGDRVSPYVFPAPKDPRRHLSAPQLTKLWDRMRRRAGVKGVKFHWLRHSFYSRALLEKKEPVQLVSIAGGTSIVTLEKRYLKPAAEQTASVARAVNVDWNGDKDSE